MNIEYRFRFPKRYELRGFERELGRMEVEALANGGAVPGNQEIVLGSADRADHALLDRLTFFEEIEASGDDGHWSAAPYQVLVERTARLKSICQETRDIDFLARQLESVRTERREHTYLTHGYHQYKGKFYPQLAKSLMNYAGIQPGDVVLDPFCGSGTTLVECFLNGVNAVGVDLHPLAAFIANVKVESLEVSPPQLEEGLTRLASAVGDRFGEVGLWDEGLETLSASGENEPFDSSRLAYVDVSNREYLERWFEPAALAKLGILVEECNRVSDRRVRRLALLTLSNLVRWYSLQEPGQLRVRRRKTAPRADDVLARFVRGVRKNASAIYLFHALRRHREWTRPDVTAHVGDVRRLDRVPSEYLQKDGQVDGVITSPPYATALPYVDTDRLSLFLLGLLQVKERRGLEQRMIGNREIRELERRRLEEEFLSGYDQCPLPKSVKGSIREILELNRSGNVGFRRRNKASLLYRYFMDMRSSFIEIGRVLKPGGICAVIIGNSRTKAGGKLVEIATDDFLIDIAESLNFELVKRLPMTDQAAYMVHSRQGIRTETIFALRKP